MAMTGSLAASAATSIAGPGGPNVTMTLTVSNSATLAIDVVGLRPYVYDGGTTNRAGGVRTGVPVLNKSNSSVPLSGSTTFNFDVVFDYPRSAGAAGSDSEPATKTYDVGCEVDCADGTVIFPTVVTITVSPVPHS